MVRNQWHSRYPEISMVRSVYSFILRYYTLVNVPVVITSFFPFCRMKEDFMELYLVREQFQSDIIGKVNC